MKQPKFEIGQKVRLINDTKMSGNILSLSFDSDSGYTYKISSKYYDAEKNEMIEGVMICKESEIEKYPEKGKSE